MISTRGLDERAAARLLELLSIAEAADGAFRHERALAARRRVVA